MLYVFISICFSIGVSVLLKLAKRYHIDVYQAITWNYAMAMFLAWMFLKPQIPHLADAPLALYVVLGILLPTMFMAIAVSVKVTGIVRTDVAQRLSLFIPLLAAFALFHEQFDAIKLTGIAIGFAAIICCIPWQKQVTEQKAQLSNWVYPLIVFIGMGIIDVLFKEVAVFKQITSGTSLFIVYTLAFIVSLAGLLYQVVTKRMRFSWPHIFIGWLLGIINFGNILFYIKAHQVLSHNPSVVFSSMNIGVILFGTFTGVFFFKEKLTWLNIAGIFLAVIAIVVIFHPRFVVF